MGREKSIVVVLDEFREGAKRRVIHFDAWSLWWLVRRYLASLTLRLGNPDWARATLTRQLSEAVTELAHDADDELSAQYSEFVSDFLRETRL